MWLAYYHMMYVQFPKLSVSLRSRLYKILVQTTKMGNSVWNAGITVCQSDQLERIQKRGLRIILGPEYICYDNALQQCNITTLKERRTSISLKFAKDLYNSGHFKDWLPIKVRKKVQYSLRNSNNFINIRCRTDRYKNSAIPYFVKLLNE